MKKPERKIERVNPTQAARDRVKAIKDILPRSYKTILFQHYPEYDSPKGRTLLINVMALISTDLKLTEILERIANGKLKSKQSELKLNPA